MKVFFSIVSFFFLLLATSIHAASDADVTIIKATKVVIEANTITISAKAQSTIRLVSGDYDADYKGTTWHGMPVSVVEAHTESGTFIIKRPLGFGHDEIIDNGWKMSLEAAKSLQAGNEVGRIGFYAPDMVIKGNLIDSMTGFGFLYPKGK